MAARGTGGLIARALSRLRHPQLFLLLFFLFVLSMLWPDPLPLVDEAILAVLTLLVGQWKKEPEVQGKPPEKNITPDE